MLTNFDMTRPLTIARNIVVNRNLDGRKRFRVILHVADGVGRNREVLDTETTLANVKRLKWSGPINVGEFGHPLVWTITVLHPDQIDPAVHASPFKSAEPIRK